MKVIEDKTIDMEDIWWWPNTDNFFFSEKVNRMNWIDDGIQRFNTALFWTEENPQPSGQRAHSVPSKVNENR